MGKSGRLKLLLLNGSHSEIPLIRAAKKLGFYVITTGNDQSLIGHAYADEYQAADFSDRQAILNLARKLEIDAICSCANDFGILTAAYVAEELGLGGHDSYETSLILHHKDLFKEFALSHNISTAYAAGYQNIEEALNAKICFPVIIKPTDLTGGKGISIVRKAQDYEIAIKKAFAFSRVKKIVVEEFIAGTQHSFSTFIANKKVKFCFSDNEYSYINPFLVSTSVGSADNIDIVKQELINAVEKIASLLSLVDGIFHIQYLFNGNHAQIIEITRRCSGDLYPYPVYYALKIDWAELIVRSEVAMECSLFPKVAQQEDFFGRHCIMASQNGVIKNIFIADEIKQHICDQMIWGEVGDKIDDFMVQKFGILLLQFESEYQRDEIISQINKLVYVEIQKD